MFANLSLLFLVSLAWAGDNFLIGWADRALPPITVSAGTVAGAALLLLPLIAIALRRPLLATLKARPRVPLIMAVSAIGLPELSVVAAEDRITPDLASLVGITVPIVTFLISAFVTRQTPYSHVRMAGVGVAIAGMLVFVGIEDLGAEANELGGILIMMAGGVVFAFNGIYASYEAKDLDPYALTFWIMAFGAVGLAIAALIFEAGEVVWPPAPAFASLGGAGLVLGLAYAGYYALIARAGATMASFYAYLVPPLGLVLGILLLGEAITANHLGGVGLTLAGLWLLLRPVRPSHPTRERGDDARAAPQG